MIKINAIKVEPTTQSTVTDSGSASVRPQAINSIKFLSSFNTLGHSSISFKGIDFYQTLNENYFQLPKKAAPDKYQKRAADALYNGHDVLVTAPTGTGKTAIAYYTISKNMEDGKRTFYTTPLKALSNEKYRQLQSIYGKENVGLLTGDTKVNTKAPIIVMTTEIYRNMVFGDKFKEKSENLTNLKTVIFDELHYLGDVDRGGVWEQSIILSDPKTQLLSLSATIGNKETMNDWMSEIRGQQTVPVNVPPEERHVPLHFQVDRVQGQVKGFGKKAKETAEKEAKANPSEAKDAPPTKKSFMEMVSRLQKIDSETGMDKLPAIFFVFSKKASKQLLEDFVDDGATLTSKDDQAKIRATVQRYKKEGKYLGETINYEALSKGYAIHNSGLLPAQKELVEELFQNKLLKVIIATETLAAGINMPARTTVITSTRKPTSLGTADGPDGKRELTPNEFHQMAGRAGRRGIDTLGYVRCMATSTPQLKTFEKLTNSKPNSLESRFSPDYSFIAGYYNKTQDDDLMNEIFHKSLFSYDKKHETTEAKVKEMFNVFEDKKSTLRDFGYMDDGNILTAKGDLLAVLNGYEQIPVVNTIYDKKLAGLSPVELAACVGTMANIDPKFEPKIRKPKDGEESDDSQPKEAEFEHDNAYLTTFVNGLEKDLDEYNASMADKEGYIKIAQNKNIAKHLYEWADLNSTGENSKLNWREIMHGELVDTIRDEGGLFREITQTVDLLKQMSKIAQIGKSNATTPQDYSYYKELEGTIKESIKLIAKEPVLVHEDDEN